MSLWCPFEMYDDKQNASELDVYFMCMLAGIFICIQISDSTDLLSWRVTVWCHGTEVFGINRKFKAFRHLPAPCGKTQAHSFIHSMNPGWKSTMHQAAPGSTVSKMGLSECMHTTTHSTNTYLYPYHARNNMLSDDSGNGQLGTDSDTEASPNRSSSRKWGQIWPQADPSTRSQLLSLACIFLFLSLHAIHQRVLENLPLSICLLSTFPPTGLFWGATTAFRSCLGFCSCPS